MKTLLRLGTLMCLLLFFAQLAFAQAAAPVISPAAGSYASTQSVTVTDSTSGADIFCTTDGSTPTPESTKYTGPITLTSNTTVKCVAAVAGVRQNNIQNLACCQPSVPGSAWKAPDWSDTGGNRTPTSVVHSTGHATPSLSGASMELSFTGAAGGQTNVLFATGGNFAKCDSCTYHLYDYYLYDAASNDTAHATTEQDRYNFMASNGLRDMDGAQWRRGTGGCASGHECLDIAGNGNTGTGGGSTWVYSGVSTTLFTTGAWHHFQRAEHTVPAEFTTKPCTDRNGVHWACVHEDSWSVDGTVYNNGGAGWTYPINSLPGGWGSVDGVQHQGDIGSGGGTWTEYLDNANYVSYFPASTTSSSAFTITGGTGTPTAATPSIAPAGGFVSGTQTVTLADSTPGAAIHYTTDGSTPTSSSSTYSTALSVTTTTTVKALAIASGYLNSSVASAVYSFSGSGGLTATPTFSPTGGSYTSTQYVVLSDTTSGAVIYYTTDGTAPTTASNVYSVPLAISATATVKAMAVAPGFTNSSVASATFTITSTLTVATPTFTPVAGNYAGTQTVTINCPSGATCHYTTDGSTPTGSSTTYSTPLSVSSTTTVKAIGIQSGLTNSAIGTALYTIGCGLTPLATGSVDISQLKAASRLGVGPKLQTAAGPFTTNDLSIYDCNGVAVDSGTLLSALATKAGVQQQSYVYAADTGTANAYAVTLSPAPTIVAGSEVSFKVGHTNTGASTLAVNGGSATAIKKVDGATALASGDWTAGQMVTVKYDGTNWQWGGGSTGGGGTVTASAIQQQSYVYAADTGAANAYVVTLSPAPSIVAGSHVVFKATSANTGASTLAVNGGSATAIKKQGSTALASGDIASGQVEEVVYDGTNYQLIASSSTGGSGPTLQTNGTNNGSQTTLNIKSGSGATVTNSGADVTISASGSGGFSVYPTMTIPLSANFSWLNPNSYSVTNTDKTDRLLLVIPPSATGVAWMQTAALPSTPYTIDAGFIVHSNYNIILASIALKNTSAGTIRSFGVRIDNAGVWYFNGQAFTSVTAPSTQFANTNGAASLQTIIFTRITDDGTNRKWYFSANGKDYELAFSEASGTGVSPNAAGLIFYNANSAMAETVSVYHWLVSSSVLAQYAP